MNCNRMLFGITEVDDLDFSRKNEKKTDFALKLLVEDQYTGYSIPSYIRDGLIWLNRQARTGGQ